jgi:signal transduction histidine kinase
MSSGAAVDSDPLRSEYLNRGKPIRPIATAKRSTANIAHVIRTPLPVVSGRANIDDHSAPWRIRCRRASRTGSLPTDTGGTDRFPPQDRRQAGGFFKSGWAALLALSGARDCLH